MSRVTTRPRPRPASSWKKSGPMLLLIIAGLGLGWPRPGVAETSPGAVILVGDVLPFNQRNVWNRIVEHAPELVIVAAASDRPKLYGEFARRALERHGAFAELLPVAVDAAEFGIDPRRAGEDPALVEQVRDAAGVFFVGGAPQRLAGALFRADGTQTPLASAIVDLHAEGGAVVGGAGGCDEHHPQQSHQPAAANSYESTHVIPPRVSGALLAAPSDGTKRRITPARAC